MRNRVRPLIASAAGFLMVGSVFAHHGSRASYDMAKPVTMEGIVTEFMWQNPHVYIMYDVKDVDGSRTHWGAETNSPIVMGRNGWTKNR